MTTYQRLVLCTALLLTPAVGLSQEGEALVVAKGCVACHGVDGQGAAPSFPNLGGQWERYLRLQLMAYRSGQRQNAIMNAQSSGLTDDEIRALAVHYDFQATTTRLPFNHGRRDAVPFGDHRGPVDPGFGDQRQYGQL